VIILGCVYRTVIDYSDERQNVSFREEAVVVEDVEIAEFGIAHPRWACFGLCRPHHLRGITRPRTNRLFLFRSNQD
jgi:hypothetical protein